MGVQTGFGIAPNEFDKFAEARAAAVVGRLEEPLEIGRAQLKCPARLQHSQRTRVLDLLFLRGCLLQELDAFGGCVRCLQVGERFAQEPVLFEVGCGEMGVEMLHNAPFHFGIRFAQTNKRDLIGARQRELAGMRELGPIHLAEGFENGCSQLGINLRSGIVCGRIFRVTADHLAQSEQRNHALVWIRLGQGPLLPLFHRLMHYRRHRRPTDEPVAIGQMRPGLVHRVLVLLAVKVFQLLPQDAPVMHRALHGRRGGFLAGVGHTIHTRLHLATADGEVHRAIFWANNHVRHRQGAACNKCFTRARVAGAIGFEMHRVNLAPTPIENEKGVLILGRKLRAVAEYRTRGRAGADVHRRREGIRIKLRPLARAVAPAPHAAAGHVINARGAIP